MNELNKEYLAKLSQINAYPSLSLYMPTHRTFPENSQDIIRYKNLVKELEESLLTDHSHDEVIQILKPFEILAADQQFWNHTLDGLAVLSSKDAFEFFKLSETVKELTVVRPGFYLSPLHQYLQSAQRYYVLGLSLNEIQLFEGNRYTLNELTLPENISTNIQDALGGELTEKHSTVASYGGAGAQSSAVHHGKGGKKDEVGKDAERFFRVVASEIESFLSGSAHFPIIIAALPEHHHLFKSINKNASVMEQAISFNPKSIAKAALAELAWEIISDVNKNKYQALAEKYGQAKADKLGSDIMDDLMTAVSEGRVDTLLVSDNLNVTNGTFAASGTKPDENLEKIDEAVIRMGGQVIFLAEEHMPTANGYAAIYRY